MSEKFEPVKYGKEYKKITFYDSDKRHADLRIRLQYDGMKQSEFFRAVVTAYLEKDDHFMAFLEQKEVKSKFALDEGEIDSIFDLLEEEHPDL